MQNSDNDNSKLSVVIHIIRDMTQATHTQYADLWISSKPLIKDPRELQTILTTSLRALWGNWESYSTQLRVQSAQSRDNDNNPPLLLVTCLAEHAPQIQAALALVTPPPYLEETLYCLDVVKMEYRSDKEDG